jgi:hypothetical protein
MADSFASPKRRLARAKEQTADARTRLAEFLNSKPYASVVERNARGFDEYKVKLTRQIPGAITDLVYEAIEALRSALDQAIYVVAVAAKAKRPDLMHFPIADNATEFENVLKGRTTELPPDILTLLRSFEPYESGNVLIWGLNRIRRQASHRLIIPVGTTSAALEILQATMSSPLPATVYTEARWDSAKDEIIFAETGPNANFKYKVNLSFLISFGPVEALAGAPALDTLEVMADEVERIILALEAESRRIGLVP